MMTNTRADKACRSMPSMLSEGIDFARLDQAQSRFTEASKSFLGYPTNLKFDYSDLAPFLAFALNNVGDPFQSSHTQLNTLDFEREVIDAFAWMTGADEDDYWGYVTSGGTEGNMYGLYLARELHPEGMVYFSEHTHYSVPKILRLQHTPSIMLKAQNNGEMDYDDLRESLKINRHRPPIIFANIGTTMTGAIDNLDRIQDILKDLAIPRSYIHADAALHGMGLAFMENPPPWNFKAGIDSISVSGHKWLGCPLPCGMAMARRQHVDRIARAVEYVGVNDTTITGSRNAHAPLMLWYALRKLGEPGLRATVTASLRISDYAIAAFKARGVSAWRNENSPIVVFPRPSHDLIKRWSLAPDREIAHIVCLAHVEEQTIDRFVTDYCADMNRNHS
ncbi:histidine decarboxylase [Haloferula rosea]|uniref:Histidine decarboxylase n=2 Tax=Haloferula rosea TaxID=490093 RepID=A0A934RED5_9BACT|nr:histidine decarboxylase [Haloferula rosea]